MAEYIKTGRRGHLCGHSAGVFRVEQSDGGLEPPARDAGLGVHLAQIENRNVGGFAARAGRGGNRYQRFQRTPAPASPCRWADSRSRENPTEDSTCKDSRPWQGQ